MNDSTLKVTLRQEIESLANSASHDFNHLERVLHFAQQLQGIYGGDIEIITAAVMLHDLGRSDTTLAGRKSALKSVELAHEILSKKARDFPAGKIDLVCEAISEHDQSELSPRTLEGKILKDADFLAGIGPWGVVRSALWTGETHQSYGKLIERLAVKMQARVNSLEFPASRRLAHKEYLFVRFFLSELDKQPSLSRSLSGKYIILEGISGTGKETQSERLIQRLKEFGREVVPVAEPTEWIKPSLHLWRDGFSKTKTDGRLGELFLFAGDRYGLVSSQIMPALEKGNIVVSVRSFISSMVYQTNEDATVEYIAYLHQYVPVADLVILLDVPPEVAEERIMRRLRETGKVLSVNEVHDRLSRDREKYRNIITQYFPQARIVNSAQRVEDVENEIWQNVVSSGILS